MKKIRKKRQRRDLYEFESVSQTLSSFQSKKKIKACKTSNLALMGLITTMSSYYSFSIILCWLRKSLEQSAQRSETARLRQPRPRMTWNQENKRFSDRMFYRLFRMPRGCFNDLCYKIEKVLGENTFKSETYLEKFKDMGSRTKQSCMYNNSATHTGAYISGEIKVAITLRMLAGASYLDMYLWMNINVDYIHILVQKVMREWFCHDAVMCIDFYKTVLQNKKNLDNIKEDFATKSGDVLDGCIGALDGWLVRITCPRINEVKNPGKYFSRKGFYAINVQAIVDKKKDLVEVYWGKGFFS